MNKLKTNIYAYYNLCLDTDDSFYFDLKDEIIPYNSSNYKINQVLKYYRDKINDMKSYYVKNNFLCFTLNNVKYYTIISDFIVEEQYINLIINELYKCGCENIVYKQGVID